MPFSNEKRKENYLKLRNAGFDIKMATMLKDRADWKIDYLIRQKKIQDDMMEGHIKALSGVGGFKASPIPYQEEEDE